MYGKETFQTEWWGTYTDRRQQHRSYPLIQFLKQENGRKRETDRDRQTGQFDFHRGLEENSFGQDVSQAESSLEADTESKLDVVGERENWWKLLDTDTGPEHIWILFCMCAHTYLGELKAREVCGCV